MTPIRVASFFSGIGGIELGLVLASERFEIVSQSEIDPCCCAILRERFEGVPNLGNIKTVRPEDIPDADLWVAGFPCQDFSIIGKGVGLSGKRGGLWRDLFRAVRVVRPRVVLLENVPAILERGMGGILGDLAGIGYDTEWNCLRSSDFGAPSIRNRWFCCAYSGSERLERVVPEGTETETTRRMDRESTGLGSVSVLRELPMYDPPGARARLRLPADRGMDLGPLLGSSRWAAFTGSLRVDPRFPERVHRLRALGNSVCVPVISAIGRRLAEII